MTAAGNVLRIIPETLNELRLDVQEIVEFVCEQFGLDDVWTRASRLLANIRGRSNTRKERAPIAGRNRSLIRKIGSRLDLKPPKRCHFRVVDVAREHDEHVADGLVCLANDLTSNGQIRHRWSMPEYMIRPCLETCYNGNDDTAFVTFLDCSPSQSTPIKPTTINRTAAFDVPTDEDNLRAELERLRLQIAAIVSIKESAKCSPVIHGKEFAGPPLPPPLPPQPLFTSRSGLPIDESSVIPVKTQQKPLNLSSSGFRMDLTEILKDIGNVKLRKVDRSPGGTPLRNKDRFISDPNDPAAIIAAALKRRFSHLDTLQESAEREQLDLSAWDSSDSFTSPFGSPVKEEPIILQHSVVELAY